LGCSYELGEGVKIDLETAAQWYQRAAEQGYYEAQFNLGILCYGGRGVAQSYDEAVRLLRLVAAQGSPDAFYNLAVCYAKGQGVPRDDAESLRFLKSAAAQECSVVVEGLAALKPAATRAGRRTIPKLVGQHRHQLPTPREKCITGLRGLASRVRRRTSISPPQSASPTPLGPTP